MENDLKIEVNIKRVIDSWRDNSSELDMKIRWKKDIIKFIISKHLLRSGIQKKILVKTYRCNHNTNERVREQIKILGSQIISWKKKLTSYIVSGDSDKTSNQYWNQEKVTTNVKFSEKE